MNNSNLVVVEVGGHLQRDEAVHHVRVALLGREVQQRVAVGTAGGEFAHARLHHTANDTQAHLFA